MAPPLRAGSYLRRIDSCITQLKAQGPSRTCNESKEEDEEALRAGRCRHYNHHCVRGGAGISTTTACGVVQALALPLVDSHRTHAGAAVRARTPDPSNPLLENAEGLSSWPCWSCTQQTLALRVGAEWNGAVALWPLVEGSVLRLIDFCITQL